MLLITEAYLDAVVHNAKEHQSECRFDSMGWAHLFRHPAKSSEV